MASQWLCSVKNQLLAKRRESRRAKGNKPFCKVPASLRRGVNKEEYEPILFSFGPYHAKLPSPCDGFKLQAATALTSVTSFDDLVEKITMKDSDIRDLYAEPWDHMSEDQVPAEALAHLLALDALTIVAAVFDPEIFQPDNVYVAVVHDAWLLDNQLPLFVLQYAIQSIEQLGNNPPSLESVIRACAMDKIDYPCPQDDFWSRIAPNQSMIGYVYDMLTGRTSPASSPAQSIGIIGIEIPTPPKPDDDQGAVSSVLQKHGRSTASQLQICGIKFDAGLKKKCSVPARTDKLKLPTASLLHKCGIKFDACDEGRFTGIKFNKCTSILILPKITLYNSTASFLLNLAAYEVASFPSTDEKPVVSYIEMMDDLVNLEEDNVRLLGGSQLRARVIENKLGSDRKAASIWNKMRFGLPDTKTRKDKEVIKDVNDACKIMGWHKVIMGWHKVITRFREYLNKKPWLLVSIISAFILLVLTFLQTMYSMKLYYLQ